MEAKVQEVEKQIKRLRSKQQALRTNKKWPFDGGLVDEMNRLEQEVTWLVLSVPDTDANRLKGR